MSEYQFSSAERYAVFVTHGERCYMCTEPVDLKSMQVDHIIPEKLESEPATLASILANFALPDTFKINSYENWMPACTRCNNRKRALVFRVTPIIQVELQRAADRAALAREREAEVVSSKKIGNALNVLQRAHAQGELDETVTRALMPLVRAIIAQRPHAEVSEPVRLTPGTVIREENGYLVIQGVYGIGHRPKGARVDPSWDCSNCGAQAAWNGVICVMCGHKDCD